MATSSTDKEFVDYLVDLMQSIGPIRAKRMFGGHGIFLEDLMFALVSDSVLYLKADETTIGEFTDNGLDAFTYNKKGKEFKMSYYQCPEEALESSEEMNVWANKACTVALTAAAKKQEIINNPQHRLRCKQPRLSAIFTSRIF